MSVLRGVMLLWTALIAAPAEASGVFDDVSELKAAVDDVTTAEETHGPLAEWDVSRVNDMSFPRFFPTGTGFFPTNFDGDVSKWDTASVTHLYRSVSATPRRGAATGPSPAASFAAGAPLTASHRPAPPQFHGATSFNADLSKWDTSSVTSFSSTVSTTPRRGGAAGRVARRALAARASAPLSALEPAPTPHPASV